MKLIARQNRPKASGGWYYRYDITVPREVVRQMGWERREPLHLSLHEDSLLLARPTKTMPTNVTLVARASRSEEVVEEKQKALGDQDAYLRYDLTIPPKFVKSLEWEDGVELDIEVVRGKVRIYRRA